ncbi:MAG: nitrilase-related carbon-nitrogen hydrolase [Fimbriimonadaceae bacterium]
MIVAACNWEAKPCQSFWEFEDHFEKVAAEADRNNVSLLVLPELFTLELLGIGSFEEYEVPKLMNEYVEQFFQMLRSRAKLGGMTIVGGSILSYQDGVARNLCPIAYSDGTFEVVAKQRHTVYESETWKLKGDNDLAPPRNGVGVLLCYDSEFPEAARALCEAGAKVICVPAYTETKYGFTRVRVSAKARCIENQVFGIHASLVGGWKREPLMYAYGTSTVLSPVHRPFPSNGVLAETDLDLPGLAIEEIDLDAVDRIRGSAEVRNWNDRVPLKWRVRDLEEVADSETRNQTR